MAHHSDGPGSAGVILYVAAAVVLWFTAGLCALGLVWR